MFALEDLIMILDLCSEETSIKGYYNEEIGFYPSTIFDGYDINSKENQRLLNNSIPLIHINDEFIKQNYNVDYYNVDDKRKHEILKEIAVKWCNDNDIKIKIDDII